MDELEARYDVVKLAAKSYDVVDTKRGKTISSHKCESAANLAAAEANKAWREIEAMKR